MKKLRSLVLLLPLILLAPLASAQPVKFGVKAGMLFPRQHIKYDGKRIHKNQDFLFGYQAGVQALYLLPFFGWELQADALFARKGCKYSYEGKRITAEGKDTYDIVHTTSVYYVDFPIKVNYSIGLSDTGFFLGLGPTLSVGVGGSEKDEGTDRAIRWDEDDSGFSRFDWALSAQLGVRFMGAQLSLFYDYGLFNIAKTDRLNIHNQNFGFNLGYLF